MYLFTKLNWTPYHNAINQPPRYLEFYHPLLRFSSTETYLLMPSGASSPFHETALYHCHLLPFQLLLHLVFNKFYFRRIISKRLPISFFVPVSPLLEESDLCSFSSLMTSSQTLHYLVAIYFSKAKQNDIYIYLLNHIQLYIIKDTINTCPNMSKQPSL